MPNGCTPCVDVCAYITDNVIMVVLGDKPILIVHNFLHCCSQRQSLWPCRTVMSFLQVPYASFVPSHLLSTFTIARPSAIVVDVGYKETTVLPVSITKRYKHVTFVVCE